MYSNMAEIGARLRAVRKEQRYTQEYIAERVDIGTKFLSQIECGRTGISIETLYKLCLVLQVSADFIVSGEHSIKKNPVSILLREFNHKEVKELESMLISFSKICK